VTTASFKNGAHFVYRIVTVSSVTMPSIAMPGFGVRCRFMRFARLFYHGWSWIGAQPLSIVANWRMVRKLTPCFQQQ
jgi:hypothetical protein